MWLWHLGVGHHLLDVGGCLHAALGIELQLLSLPSLLLLLCESRIVTLADLLEGQVLARDVVADSEAGLLQALEDGLLVELEDILEQVVAGLEVESILTDHFGGVQGLLLLLERFLDPFCWIFWLEEALLLFLLGEVLFVSLEGRASVAFDLLLDLGLDVGVPLEMAIGPWHVVEGGRRPVAHGRGGVDLDDAREASRRDVHVRRS